MRILILDDDNVRHVAFNNFFVGKAFVKNVSTAEQCINELENNQWDIVFLDHDLGGDTFVVSDIGTGWEVAKWIHDHPDKKPYDVIIHSFNPSGAHLMKNLIKDSMYIPGIWNNLHQYSFNY